MSFTDKKGIVVASGFKLQAEAMLDARQRLDTIEDRDELVTLNAAVPGLRVYVDETKKSYVYNGTGWDTLNTDATYTHPTGDGNHHVPATGTNNNGKFLKAGATAGSESWQKITKADITDFPASMKNPAALTISLNGTSQGAYDGSSAKSINVTPASIGAAEDEHLHEITDIVDLDEHIESLIPESLPTTGSLTISLNGASQGAFNGSSNKNINITPSSIGAAAASHDHTSEDITDFDTAVEALIPEIPTKLPNPNALTFTGAVTGTYDGSAAKTVNIPTSGATDEDLIIKFNGGSTEGTNMFTFDGSTAKSVNITPASIGAAAASHSHTSANISDFDDAVAELIPDAPTKLPNPNALTISLNGTSQGAYDGSAAKSINITPASIGASASGHKHSATDITSGTLAIARGGTGATDAATARTNLGAAAASHTHTSGNISDFDDAVEALIPEIPTKLPNPNALTFTGAVTGTYDGSAAKTVNIPTSGTTDGSLSISLNGGDEEGTDLFTFNGSGNKEVNITPASIGAAASSHNHSAANITSGTLAVARGGTGITANPSMLVNLGSTSAASVFTTSPRPGVTGTLPIANGGTGATSAAAARTALGAAATSHSHTVANITDFEDEVAALIPSAPTKLPNPNSLTISLNGTSQGAYDGSSAKSVNITAASIGAAASSHSHSVASTSAAGFLRQLDGSTSHYLRGDGTWGTPPNTTYSNMTGATTSAAGKAGLVPAPAAGAATRYLRSDGTWQVPPDTKATLSSLGITATAAELNKLDGVTATKDEINFLDGVTSAIQTQLNGKAASSHTHNYAGSSSAGGAANSVKASIVVKLNGGTTEGTNMFTFNGSAAKTINITAAGIGAAASSHNHSAANITSGTLAIARGGTGATDAATARSNLGAAAASHTHNYAGSSSAGGAATSANKVPVPVGTVLFGTSSSATFFTACFGGTWTVVGNVDAIINDGDSTLKLYMFRKTAA